MSFKDTRESSLYLKSGASSSKKVLDLVVKNKERDFFCPLLDDPLLPDEKVILHSDGAGTKPLLAYLAYKLTGETAWFEGLAWDSLVMNLNDVFCCGAAHSLFLTNTISRNKELVPDEAVSAVINGYKKAIKKLKEFGINITLAGGETADVGDIVSTLSVDSSLFARIKNKDLISFKNIKRGDLIVGIASFGKASYEERENSGIGCNGISLARQVLISKKYFDKFPEIGKRRDLPRKGEDEIDLFSKLGQSSLTLLEALLSPTRVYAPFLLQLYSSAKESIHGVVHCTGGGQTKILNFGKGVFYCKEKFFPPPLIFKKIQEKVLISSKEMYQVFNMGHLLELIIDPVALALVASTASSFNLPFKVIGEIKDTRRDKNLLFIRTPDGEEFKAEL
ncbi:MAG: phosphoribosylformylglycinamidine cyclo-ligase [Candidatus Dadabacteria bacterium]|nr:MAG: phosphoribosylformylglycinamidine cyclo-ligase [Candidatus Dadabacteria bacterium]